MSYHEDIGEIDQHSLIHILSSAGDVKTDSRYVLRSSALDEIVCNRELEDLEGGIFDGVGKV